MHANGAISSTSEDHPPGATVEFPATRSLAEPPSREEDDYLAEIFEAEESDARAVSGVRWATPDKISPCYCHLLIEGTDNLAVEQHFEIGKAEFDLLVAANRFRPQGMNEIIAFGLRGARLRDRAKVEQVERLALEDVRPDHKDFRCVVGYYFRSTGRFSAYTGSTVPWHGYMAAGQVNNMLPTGCYVYKVGTHKPKNTARWVAPALRLSDARGADSGQATVLRTRQNLVFDLRDAWDQCAPGDNVHCAYAPDKFSSLGCQTVKGGMHDGLWADFQATLKTLRDNARVDYVLLTGAECSIAARLVKAGLQASDPEVLRRLARLRAGSEGEEVKLLQARLEVAPTGYFGAATKKKLTEVQAASGLAADGIYTPAMDAERGWGVFSVHQGAARGIVTEVTAPGGTPRAAAAPAEEPAVPPVARPDPSPASSPQTAPAPLPRPAVALTAESFRRFAPRARPEFVNVLAEKGNDILTRFGINANAGRFCHFMAQVAHECAGFSTAEENLNYSAATMVRLFGQNHSARLSEAEARRLVGKKEAFAERIYGLGNPTLAQKLGNTQPGDGYRYRGRGFMQITGRRNYRAMGERIGVDLEANPDLAAQPVYALMTAAAFWDREGLNRYADQDNIEIITQRINGRHNGLDHRKSNLAAAMRIWSDGARGVGMSLDARSLKGQPNLEYGDLKPEVLGLKKLLLRTGAPDHFGMDEVFGADTHLAVVRFKLSRGLPADGLVDALTWAALEEEAKRVRALPTAPGPPGARMPNSGRAILRWALALFLAAVGLLAVRYIQYAGLEPPRSTWDGLVLGFIALVSLASIVLMFLGGRIARAGSKASVRALDAGDIVIRPEVNTEGAG
jgi:predicted chitinase